MNGEANAQSMTVNEDYITLEQMRFVATTNAVKGTP